MARILCSQTLWRHLGLEGRPPTEAADALIPGASLGSWAAKALSYDGRNLVLGINERTYLTVLFPLAPRREFRSNFADALASLLLDLGLPESVARNEIAAMQCATLVRLANPRLSVALNDVEFFCGIEFLYQNDLRRVQRNLNDIPHPDRDPCVPAEAAVRLLGGGTVQFAFRVS